MKFALVPVLLAFSASASAQQKLDGEVNGLNEQVFTVLQRLTVQKPAFLEAPDAREVAAAVALDGKVDAEERDLLAELSQRNIRTVSIGRGASPAGDARVMLYPSSGEAQQVLFLAIDPSLETLWTSPRHGFGELLAKPDQAYVKAYLALKLTGKANESNMANRYKPFRDLVGELYTDAALAPGSDAATGRALIHEAAQEADRAVADKLPDFLYNWVNPAAAKTAG